jgi:predicted double-glycine peptidase
MDEIRTDVKVIRHRLAYSAGAAAVILGLLGWLANSRFDQLVMLLSR